MLLPDAEEYCKAPINGVKCPTETYRLAVSCPVRAVSGVVQNPPGVKGSGGFFQRLASAWCASRFGSQGVGMPGAVEDERTDSVPPFFFFPGSLRFAGRTAYGDRLENVTAGNEQWCFQPQEERRRRRRREGGGGVVVMVMVAVCGEVSEGQNTTGSLAPTLPSLFHPSSSLSFFTPPPYPYHTHKRQGRRRRRRPPRSFFISAILRAPRWFHSSTIAPSFHPLLSSSSLQLRGYHLGISWEKKNSLTLFNRIYEYLRRY